MFDSGLLTIPLAAAASVFTVALFIGEEIVIDNVETTHQMQWNGIDGTVAKRLLTDTLRELSEGAASELTEIEVDESEVEKGIEAFQDYFDLQALINGTRNILGLIPYYIEGEFVERRNELVFNVRVFTLDDEDFVHLVSASGSHDDVAGILHRASLDILERINPYIVALYYRQTETAGRQYDYRQTHAAIERFLASRPLAEHHLAYGLLGRMHMIKAERDTSLTPEAREAEIATAMKFLHAALLQKPDFLYPLVNLGLIHAERGEVDLAERYFADAVTANPNYLITRKSWGDLLANQGRPQEAVYQYVAAVEIDPTDPDLRDKLGRAYWDSGFADAAREQWIESTKIAPTTPEHEAILRSLSEGATVPIGRAAECVHGLVPEF